MNLTERERKILEKEEFEKLAPIKTYSKGQLCMLYDNCSYQALRNWLKPIKEKLGRYENGKYSIRQVLLIFELLGRPVINDEKILKYVL